MYSRTARARVCCSRAARNATRYAGPQSPRPLAEMFGTAIEWFDLLTKEFPRLGFLECLSERSGGVRCIVSMLSLVLRELTSGEFSRAGPRSGERC
jgi:hypothetical protein